MSRKKVLIGMIALTILIAGSIICFLLLGGKDEVSPGARVRQTTTPGNEDDKISLAANSYEEIYNQILLAKIKDYIYGVSEDAVKEDAKADSAPTEQNSGDSSAMESTDNYGQTNVQVQGVDEGDIVKNDGTYLYCKKGNEVCIINAKSNDMKVESTLTGYDNLQDIYISDNKMILLSQKGQSYYFPEYAIIDDAVSIDQSKSIDEYVEPQVKIDVYDITNRKKPVLKSKKTMDGWLMTSRISEGYLYVISNKNMQGIDYKKEEPATYVPKVDDRAMPYDDVIIPDTGVTNGYLVITSLSLLKPDKFIDQKAILSNGYNFYVSTSHIYIADSLYNDKGVDTLLTKIRYKNGRLAVDAQGKVNGSIKDNFSMDEYEGNLRMVTTVQDYKDDNFSTYNNLYVLNDSLKEIGKIERLAKDETIYSSRFMGEVGYFVTFRQVDPLFSVDLSNPKKPKIIGKLKIPGFSSYLHFYGDNLLLGIGQDADADTGRTRGLKLSMFDISDPGNVKEVHKLYLGENTDSEILYNYKAIMVNSDKNIIGFSYRVADSHLNPYYGVYNYDETMGFTEEFTYKQHANNYANLRGTYIGDTIYILSLAQFDYANYRENSYVNAYHRSNYKLIEKLNLD